MSSSQPPDDADRAPGNQSGDGPPSGYDPVYQQYGQPYYVPQQPWPQAGMNGMAIASMVLGILWLYWVGSVLALIFGYIARSQIKQRRQDGDGMAIAGIILGWIGVAALLVVLIAFIVVLDDVNTCAGRYC